jgi:hypothetical protein
MLSALGAPAREILRAVRRGEQRAQGDPIRKCSNHCASLRPELAAHPHRNPNDLSLNASAISSRMKSHSRSRFHVKEIHTASVLDLTAAGNAL